MPLGLASKLGDCTIISIHLTFCLTTSTLLSSQSKWGRSMQAKVAQWTHTTVTIYHETVQVWLWVDLLSHVQKTCSALIIQVAYIRTHTCTHTLWVKFSLCCFRRTGSDLSMDSYANDMSSESESEGSVNEARVYTTKANSPKKLLVILFHRTWLLSVEEREQKMHVMWSSIRKQKG